MSGIFHLIIDWLDDLTEWPQKWKTPWLRKAFVLLLPISFPIWLAYFIFMCAIAIAFMIVLGIVLWIESIWDGECK